VVPRDSIHRDHSHDLIPELVEKFALKGLGEVVGHHFFRGAVLDRNLLAGNAIGDEKISNVDVAGSFPTGGLTVVGELDHALIILVQDGGDTVALCLHKVFSPEGLWENVVDAD
jgi:hypothetical protein